jgi:hypothetical protein
MSKAKPLTEFIMNTYYFNLNMKKAKPQSDLDLLLPCREIV